MFWVGFIALQPRAHGHRAVKYIKNMRILGGECLVQEEKTVREVSKKKA